MRRRSSSRRAFSASEPKRGILVLRAQPADLAGLLLYGALLVERDEPPQDLLVRKRRRPAIGFEDELIQPLVQFLQDENEALVLDALVFGVEGRARLQLFERCRASPPPEATM